jgi:hypothetical protein
LDCRGKHTRVCPADKVLLRRTIATCESALFFNEPHRICSLCNRRILSQHFTPQFVKLDQDWIYSVPKKEAVTIKCTQNGTSFTTDKVIEGRGIIHNAAKCNIIGTDFKVKSAQQTNTLSTLRHHEIIWPEPFEPLLSHEVQDLRETRQTDYNQLDRIASTAEVYLNQNLQLVLQEARRQKQRQESTRLTWICIATAIAITILITTTTVLCKSYVSAKFYNFVHGPHSKKSTPANVLEQVSPAKAGNPDAQPSVKACNPPMEEEATSCNASFNLSGLQTS